MDTRRLLSSTVLYGVANIAVMAVGGFLLLPLYTRTLSQDEFGAYVAIRANVDLFTYLLQFGLPSAAARAYFDYKRQQRQHEYLSSVINLFLLLLAGAVALLWLWGPSLWRMLSPATPVHPFLALSVAIAAVGFPSALATTWLRMESRVKTVVGLQLGSAALLATLATLCLAAWHLGLAGLLGVMLLSSALPAVALPWLLGRHFSLAIRREHVVASLHYALPILVGYIAYFVLNRFSTLVLQRHVAPQELAVYGLAQQLAMVVGIAATSFGMALQPRVFAAEPSQAAQVLERSARLLTLLMTGITAGLILFAPELLALVGPASYRGGLPILLLLLVANFTSAFTLISETALLYQRRPKTSVMVSILSAVAAAALGLWLIPQHGIDGAAIAVAGGLIGRMLVSHWITHRMTGYSSYRLIGFSISAMFMLAAVSMLIDIHITQATINIGSKMTLLVSMLPPIYYLYKTPRPSHAQNYP